MLVGAQTSVRSSLSFEFWLLFAASLVIFGALDANFEVEVIEESLLTNTNLTGAEGSLYNRLSWLTLLGVGIVSAWHRGNVFMRYLPGLWPLLLLFGWCAVSILWSDHPEYAFRRVSFLIVVAAAIFFPLTSIRHVSEALLALFAGLAVVILMNVAVLPLPSAYHVVSSLLGDFRGIHSHKNFTGSIMLLAAFWAFTAQTSLPPSSRRSGFIIVVLLSIALLVLSHSKTSLALLILIPPMVAVVQRAARLFRMPDALAMLISALTLIFFIMLVHALTGYNLLQMLKAATGVEVTFTGRTDVWRFVSGQLQGHWWLGYGFGSFYQVGDDSPTLNSTLYWIRNINQSHNGYLDMVVGIGLIGLSLMVPLLLSFSSNMEKIKRVEPGVTFWLWCIMVFCIVHNAMESSLIRTNHAIWVSFLIVFILSVRLARDGALSHRFSTGGETAVGS